MSTDPTDTGNGPLGDRQADPTSHVGSGPTAAPPTVTPTPTHRSVSERASADNARTDRCRGPAISLIPSHDHLRDPQDRRGEGRAGREEANPLKWFVTGVFEAVGHPLLPQWAISATPARSP